nr:glycosyltransferase family 61 protein [Tessaracoccus sp. OS52]
MLKFAGGRAWSNGLVFEPDEVIPADRERPLVLLKQVWDANYGHWLLDALPKVAAIAGLHDPQKVRLVLNIRRGGMLKVVRETLAMAGFREDQLVFMDNRPRLFRELTVLGTVSVHPTRKAPRAFAWLAELGRELPEGKRDRIYVSRNKYHRRRLENEEELLPVLHEFGYEVVHPEELDFAGQVSLFKGASFVAGNMGAALSNLAFSPEGVTVVALATQGMKHDFFYDLVCHKRGRYRGLQGWATQDPDDIGSNFTVAPERLREVLEWAHRPTAAA